MKSLRVCMSRLMPVNCVKIHRDGSLLLLLEWRRGGARWRAEPKPVAILHICNGKPKLLPDLHLTLCQAQGLTAKAFPRGKTRSAEKDSEGVFYSVEMKTVEVYVLNLLVYYVDL